MDRPSYVPRRIEKGDVIRSPEFATGTPMKNGMLCVGRAKEDKDRLTDAERGKAWFTVTEAKEVVESIGGILLRMEIRLWDVYAERTLGDGTVERINFVQFGDLPGILNYLIPTVDFKDEEEAKEKAREEFRNAPNPYFPYDESPRSRGRNRWR